MEPYAVVPCIPNWQEPFGSLTNALHADAMMSPSFAYPDPNEGLWRMINTLPQLSNAANLPRQDALTPKTLVNDSHITSNSRSGAYLSPNQPPTPTSTHSPNHINTEPLNTEPLNTPHTLHPTAPTSELRLCKTCCATVQSLVRYA